MRSPPLSALDPLLGLQFFRPPARSATDWPSFVDLFSTRRRTKSAWPSNLETVRLWCETHLERIHEDAAMRRADLLQLEQIAACCPTCERFLTDLTLYP